MKDAQIKEKIIANGVKNQKDFGFPNVTSENILTDPMYSEFFLSSLKDNLGRGYDKIINELISEIEKNKKDGK